MTIEIRKQDDAATLVSIQEEMTIYNVLRQKDELFPLLESGQDLQIDLSAVTEIDSAGMQLLLFLKHEASKQASALNLIGHSQPVVEVVGLFNLTAFFGDPLVISADWSDA